MLYGHYLVYDLLYLLMVLVFGYLIGRFVLQINIVKIVVFKKVINK